MFNAIKFHQIDYQMLKFIYNIHRLKKEQFKNGTHLSVGTYRFRDMGERTHQGHHWS